MNYLKEHGKKMIDNGYKIVPIPEGYKWPKGLKDWQKIDSTHELVDEWVEFGIPGVAVLCEHTPAVDLDIPDKTLAGEMWEKVKQIAGEGPIRFGKFPKCMMPFKTISPFRKMQSKVYVNPMDGDPDKKYQVEILGTGNEFVAYAVHPGTKKPYVWNNEHGELYDTPRHELPTLDQYKAQEIIDAFEAMIPSTWVEYSKKSGKKSETHEPKASSGQVGGEGSKPLPPADTFANMKTKWGGTEHHLWQILLEIDPTDYRMWVDAGFAIWHETDGSDSGFKLWDEWSKRAPEEYAKSGTERDRRSKWKTYDWQPLAEEGKDFKTFKSLVFYVNGGATEACKEVSGFLGRYFLICAGSKVFDSTKQNDMGNAFTDLAEFHEYNANEEIEKMVPAPTEKDPTRVKEKTFKVSKEWQKHPDRKSCDYLTFEPGKPVINHVKDSFYEINTCQMPVFPLTEDDGLLKVWHDHMALLFPDEKDRRWFEAWIARKVQDPTDKCAVTPLLVAPEEGVGRSWLGGVMEYLFGSLNISRPEIKSLSSGNAFNSYMDDKLMCIIDEVYQRKTAHSEGKFEISSNLKSKISEKFTEINVKFEKTRTKRVYTDFLLMTNERDAINFSEANRRFAVFIYDGMPMEPEYYDRLYSWRDDVEKKGIGALWWYLKGLDVSGVDFQRAPENRAKKDMIEEGKSALDHAVDDFISDSGFKVTTPDLMLKFFRNNTEKFEGLDAFQLPNSNVIRKILMHKRCATKYVGDPGSGKIRAGGRGSKMYRPWLLDKEIEISLEEVKIELQKQEDC